MKTWGRMIVGVSGLLLSLPMWASLAHASAECRFEGMIGKERVECKANLTGNCNTLEGKVKGKGSYTKEGSCQGFEVWCDGERITTGDETCTGINVQVGDNQKGVAQFQFTDRNGSCHYPAVKFDFAIPNNDGKAHARLYLSERQVLFGKCDVGSVTATE